MTKSPLWLIMLLLAVCPSAVANPSWFPRDAVAYGEVKTPAAGWNPEFFRWMESELLVGSSLTELLTAPDGFMAGHVRTALAVVDVRLSEDLPVVMVQVLEFSAPRSPNALIDALSSYEVHTDENGKVTRQLLTKVTRTTYSGIEVFSLDAPSMAIASVDSSILMASSASVLKDVVDAMRGDAAPEESLADNPRYVKWQASKAFGNPLLRLFIDGQRVQALIDQAIGNPDQLSRISKIQKASFDLFEWRKISSVGLTIADDGVLSSALEVNFAEDPAWASIIQGPIGHTGFKYVHPESIFVTSFGVRNLSEAIDVTCKRFLEVEAEHTKRTGGIKAKGDESESDAWGRDREPRDSFASDYQESDKLFRECRRMIRQGWQEVARRYAAKHSEFPATITAEVAAKESGLEWANRALFGYVPTSVTLGALDAETGQYAGTLRYTHPDGSYFDINIAKDERIDVVDPMVEAGQFPIDPKTKQPLSESAFIALRERGRSLGAGEWVQDLRTVISMTLGSNEEEIASMLAGNLIVGLAPRNLEEAVSTEYSRGSNIYIILPLKPSAHTDRILKNFALSDKSIGFNRVRARERLASTGSVWDLVTPELSAVIPYYHFDKSVAYTGDALIFALGGHLPGMIENAAKPLQPWAIDAQRSRDAMVGYANSRWLKDNAMDKRLPVARARVVQDFVSNEMTAALRYANGKLVAEFSLRQPFDTKQLASLNAGTDWRAESTLNEECAQVEQIAMAIRELRRLEEAAAGVPSKTVFTWEAAANHWRKQAREELKALSSNLDESGWTKEELEAEEKAVAARFLGPSVVVSGQAIADAWQVYQHPAPDLEKHFADPAQGNLVQVLAASFQPDAPSGFVVVSVIERRHLEFCRKDDGTMDPGMLTACTGNVTIQKVEAEHLKKLLEKAKAVGIVPASLVDSASTLKLSDLEAAMVLPQHIRHEVMARLGEIVDKQGRWKLQSADSIYVWGMGRISRLGERRDAERTAEDDEKDRKKQVEAEIEELEKERERRSRGEPVAKEAAPKPTAVIRIECFGHWAEVDAKGLIVRSSWMLALNNQNERKNDAAE